MSGFTRLLALTCGVASLLACTEKPEPVQPVQLNAAYQLLFNDSLVGHALFTLSIDAAGRYQVEAFTSPAGKIAGQAGNEVLELSAGSLDHEQIKPQRFEHSVLQGEDMKQVSLDFDWEARQLRVSNATAEQTLALLPRTHDRLSYLIAAERLTDAEPGALHEIHLATLEATEQVVLQVIGRASTTVPYGTFDATGIRRVSLEGDAEREMWFADTLPALPIRVMRRSDGNAIEMQLESLTRADAQPASD